jgi:plastocyanin
MRINLLMPIMIFALLCPGALCPGARAGGDRVVHQKGRQFSVENMTVAQGEQVVFLNDDTVPHNIMSTTPDNAFDLGSQMPGSATPVSFDKAGDVAVLCAIHPRMHLVITVQN